MTIIEKKRRGNIIFFALSDPETGRTDTWTPPPKLTQEAWLKALAVAVKRFEAVAPQGTRTEPLPITAVSPDISLRDFCVCVFMPRKSIYIAENTRSNWQRYLDLRILPMMGNLKISEITELHLQDFLFNIHAEGLSRNSVDRYRTLLQAIFKMADEITHCGNPMKTVHRVSPRKDELIQTEVSAHTAEELAYIEKCLDREPLKWRTLFRLICDTGLRRGEACAVKWSEINFQENTIRISASLGYSSSKGVYETTPKNRQLRTVPISDDISRLLLQLYREDVFADIHSPYVFHQTGSPDPINPTSATGRYRKFRQRYGIIQSYPHKLRHSYASVAITHGADVASVAANLGHSNPDVTLRIYTSANETSKRNACNICRNAVSEAMGSVTLPKDLCFI